MTRLLLLLALGACASPPTAAPTVSTSVSTSVPPGAAAGAPAVRPESLPADDFDAQAWLALARAYDGFSTFDADDPRVPVIRELTRELGEAARWNLFVDSATGRPRPRDEVWEYGPTTGTFDFYELGSGQTIVAVLTDFGAHTGTFALLHIDGARVAVLDAPGIDGDGVVTPHKKDYYGLPEVTGTDTYTLSEFSRGTGGCGQSAQYHIERLGVASLVAARGISCEDSDNDSSGGLREPPSWPLIYPRP